MGGPYRTPEARPSPEARWVLDVLLYPFRGFRFARKRMGGHWELRWENDYPHSDTEPQPVWERVKECSGYAGPCEDYGP